jgi:hypothetical protein
MNDLEAFIEKLISSASQIYSVQRPLSLEEKRQIIINLKHDLQGLLNKAKDEEVDLILDDIETYESNWSKANPTFSYLGSVPGYNFVGFLLNLIREPIDKRKVQRENKNNL